jgi:hypothetical protein
MKIFSAAYVTLAVMISTAQAGLVTVNGFNNNTMATVSFDDGSGISGHSGSVSTLLTQFNVTYSGSPSTFNTFSIDLFHTVSGGQTYEVDARSDLATAFANGSRISYIFQNYGLQDLTQNSVQAAAAQLSLWDLSLNNHVPTLLWARCWWDLQQRRSECLQRIAGQHSCGKSDRSADGPIPKGVHRRHLSGKLVGRRGGWQRRRPRSELGSTGAGAVFDISISHVAQLLENSTFAATLKHRVAIPQMGRFSPFRGNG